jgi:hypothetical protein
MTAVINGREEAPILINPSVEHSMINDKQEIQNKGNETAIREPPKIPYRTNYPTGDSEKTIEPNEKQTPVILDVSRENKEEKEMIWIHKGKDAVKMKLKDPSSAKLQNVYFFRGNDGLPMTCGEVNSKNSLSGYGGFQRFVSAGNADLTFLEEDVLDFDTVWNRFCK